MAQPRARVRKAWPFWISVDAAPTCTQIYPDSAPYTGSSFASSWPRPHRPNSTSLCARSRCVPCSPPSPVRLRAPLRPGLMKFGKTYTQYIEREVRSNLFGCSYVEFKRFKKLLKACPLHHAPCRAPLLLSNGSAPPASPLSPPSPSSPAVFSCPGSCPPPLLACLFVSFLLDPLLPDFCGVSVLAVSTSMLASTIVMFFFLSCLGFLCYSSVYSWMINVVSSPLMIRLLLFNSMVV